MRNNVCIFLVCLLGSAIMAQSQNNTTNIIVRALEMYGTPTSDGESLYDYRINTWLQFDTGVEYYNSNCLNIQNANQFFWYPVSTGDVVRFVRQDAKIGSEFLYKISMEGWEEDGCGGECSYQTHCLDADEGHCGKTVVKTFSLYNMHPGNYSSPYAIDEPNEFIASICSGSYRVRFLVTYAPPKPNDIQIRYKNSDENYSLYNGELICNKNLIELSTGTVINPAFNNEVNYTWNYWVEGDNVPGVNPEYCGGDPDYACWTGNGAPCCSLPPYIDVPNWRTLDVMTNAADANHGSAFVNIRSLPGLGTITKNTTIYFSVAAVANGWQGTSSEIVVVNVSPEAPAISMIETDPSCSEAPSGIARLTGITGQSPSPYNYILRSGLNTSPCDPNVPGSCDNVLTSGVISADHYTFSGSESIASGDYTILLSNNGGNNGVCFNAYEFNVTPIPPLILHTTPYDVECYEANTGSVNFTLSGGNSGVTDFILQDVTSGEIQKTPSVSNGIYTFSGLVPGSYLLSADDHCTSAVSFSFEIHQPPKISQITLEKTVATCSNPPNGSFEIGIAESTGPFDVPKSDLTVFELLLNEEIVATAQLNSDSWIVSGLTPGDYILKVKEESGLECNGLVLPVQIEQVPELSLTIESITAASCSGSSDGSVLMSGSGGTGAFRFTFRNIQDDNISVNDTGVFSQLSAGYYTAMIENTVSSCHDSFIYPQEIVISQPEPLQVDLNKTDITCHGMNNGTLNAEALGGTLPYRYVWETKFNDDWVSFDFDINSIGELASGEYRVGVFDAHECFVSSSSIEIETPQPLEITSINKEDIICFGQTGTILMTAVGGTVPLVSEFSENDGATFLPFTNTTEFSKGEYMLRIRDANGCIKNASSTVTITEPQSPLKFTWQVSDHNGYNISCNGGNDGFIIVLATGGDTNGTGIYQYALDDHTFNASSHFTEITGGSHQIRVKDAVGCVATESIFLSESDPVIVEIINQINVTCFGESTGSFEILASGGAGEFLYQLGDQAPKQTNLFSGLQAGEVLVHVFDSNGCVGSVNVSILNINSPVSIIPHIKDVSCNDGQDGSIRIEGSGGVVPYHFFLNEEEKTAQISDLRAALYEIKIIDNKGCSEQMNVEIKEPEILKVSDVSVQEIKCFGEKASISVSPTGGTAPYTYQYSTDESSYTVFNSTTPFSEGTYLVKAQDSQGCQADLEEAINIMGPPQALEMSLALSDYNGFNISCRDGDNGIINILATGGNGIGYSGYQYRIDEDAYVDSQYFNHLPAGSYSVFVKDERGCEIQTQASLIENPEERILTVVDKKDVECYSSDTGEIQVALTGGTSTVLFNLNGGVFQSEEHFTGLTAGDYVITATDANQCTTSTTTSISSQYDQIALQSAVIPVNCFGGSDGSVSLDATGGSGDYKYTFDGAHDAGPQVTGLVAGSYSVVVGDSAGCYADFSVEINQPAAALQLNAVITPACFDKEDGLIQASASGGTLPYLFSIVGNSTSGSSDIFTVAQGPHVIRITDNNSCILDRSVIVEPRNPKPEPNFLVASRRNARDTLIITDISIPPPDSIQWSFDDHAIVIDLSDTSPMVKFSEPGSYPVTMKAFFSGCDYTLNKVITINPYDPSESFEHTTNYHPFQSFIVSPNPARDVVSVEIVMNRPYNLSLVLFDLKGTIFYQENISQVQTITKTLNVTGASPGIYILRAICEYGSEEMRLVINP